MGRKLDALLGRRRFKTSQFRATASLAVSRLAVLKNQRQARCSVARSDVVQLLNTNNHESAILRVDQVIKEQNMLDVFVVLEAYFHLLIDRIHLFEHEKVCPEELIEAVSTLIYAATRCGEFPELQELRAIFTSKFGKEFAARAVELRNNCGVNPKVIKKLSPRMPSLENKKRVLKEIASDNNIDLPMEEDSLPDNCVEIKEDWGGERNESIHRDDEMERSTPRRRKYKDVADAAQAAFESAAYAAAAARAAVELSRSESGDSHHPSSPGLRPRSVTDQPIKPRFDEDPREPGDDEHKGTTEIEFENIQSLHKDDFKLKKTFSSSGSDSLDDYVKVDSADSGKIEQGNVVFDESDENEDMGGNNRAEFGRKMEDKTRDVEPLNINRMPISVRRRWAQPR